MEVRKRYDWHWRGDGRCWLYAADFRALSTISKHPRRFQRLGLPLTLIPQIKAEIASLRHRAKSEEAHHCGGARPVMLLLSPRSGVVDAVYLASDAWCELRPQLQGVA